jgi:hypothetical protein
MLNAASPTASREGFVGEFNERVGEDPFNNETDALGGKALFISLEREIATAQVCIRG